MINMPRTTRQVVPQPTCQVVRGQLVNNAEIIPTVLTESGAVLDLGRSRRIASRSQTLAMIARDGGCSFPGVRTSPSILAIGTTSGNGSMAD